VLFVTLAPNGIMGWSRPGAGAGALMAEMLLEVSGVVKRFGGFTALDGVDFAVRPGSASA